MLAENTNATTTDASAAVEDDGLVPPDPTVEAVTTGGRFRRRRSRSYLRMVASVWLLGLTGLALLAPILPIPGPNDGGLPLSVPPSGEYILGTDHLGRDEFARIIFGARVSLLIGCLSVAIAMSVGVIAGLWAGYSRGRVDTVIVGVADMILAFPGLVLLMVIATFAGPSVRNLIGALAFFLFPTFMRLTRANTLSLSQREFVLAARGLGARTVRVALREVLPNVFPAVWSYALAAVGLVFVAEGSLSFLGLGIQPPTPAWGSMINAGRPYLARSPHLVLVPAAVLFLTVLAFNALSEGRAGRGRQAQLG